MKKLMIVLVALVALVSNVEAEFGDTETTVIKDGSIVHIFHAKDVTKEYYSWTEFEITSYTCKKLSAGELKSLGIPEGAWKLCSSNESGVYSTKEVRLASENKELKDANDYLSDENRILQSDKSDLKFMVFCLSVTAIMLFILVIVYLIKLKKERAR